MVIDYIHGQGGRQTGRQADTAMSLDLYIVGMWFESRGFYGLLQSLHENS
jgi:hypothetical protein